MPEFDLRYIKVAKYVNTAGVVTYTNPQSAGDAMSVDLELKFAEARLYAESALAEYIRRCTGGTATLGVKYIPEAAQKLMFGAEDKSRSVTVGGTASTVAGLAYGAKSAPGYVGLAFVAPDKVDGADKFSVVFAHKVLFGPPARKYKTFGDGPAFQTPVTSGEFLRDDTADAIMLEAAVCDSEAEAKAWVDAVLA